MEKIEKIVELGIDLDNVNDDELFEELGVDVVSFVESPAIEEAFLYFSKDNGVEEHTCNHEFASYSDYPESVRNNAKRGIELNKAVNNKCATQVGKVRAQQLAKGEAVSEETVKRMYSYLSRAAVYADGDNESCGKISYLLWGGASAKTWAESKLNQIEREEAIAETDAIDAMLEYAENNGEFMTHEDIIVDLSKSEFSTVAEVLQGLGALDILTRLNIKKDEPAEIYYRYQGPTAQRTFCKAMLRLTNQGKIFTQEEIEAMGASGVNSQFARKGASTYDIFQWVGGKYCQHFFQKLAVFRNAEGKRIVIVESPTTNAQTNASKTWSEKMSKEFHFTVTDTEQRIVTGPIMVPSKMILRRDEEGNPFYVYFSKETIAKMAEKFLAQNKQHNTDVEHDGNVIQSNTLIESWVSISSQFDKSHQMGWSLPAGTWFASFRVNDDETWNKVKSGEARGFSLAGNFINRFEPMN